jgi:hypothetical protein
MFAKMATDVKEGVYIPHNNYNNSKKKKHSKRIRNMLRMKQVVTPEQYARDDLFKSELRIA